MKRLLSCLFFLMFLIGCRNTTAMPPLVVTVTPVPVATVVVISAELTAIPPTALPSPTETPPPEPTAIPPTETPGAVQTETALPEPTVTAVPTSEIVETTLSAGPQIFTSGAPISFHLPAGWEAAVLSRELIIVRGPSADLHISIVHEDKSYVCIALDGVICGPQQPLPDGIVFDEERTFFASNIRRAIEQFASPFATNQPVIAFVDRDGDYQISAEKHHLTVSLRGKEVIHDDDRAAAEQLIASIWFSDRRDTQLLASDEFRVSDVWWSHDFESPDGIWIAQSYTIGDVEIEPTQYDIDRGLSSLATRQLFTLRKNGDSAEIVLIDLLEGTGIGVGYFSALTWTDTHLYFTYLPIPHGCGEHLTGSDLWQYDFATGQVRQIANNFGGGVLALSPDSNFLASSAANGFWLRDLSTNTLAEYVLAIPANEVQRLTWSPDGQTITIIYTPRDQMRCFLEDTESRSLTVTIGTGGVAEE